MPLELPPPGKQPDEDRDPAEEPRIIRPAGLDLSFLTDALASLESPDTPRELTTFLDAMGESVEFPEAHFAPSLPTKLRDRWEAVLGETIPAQLKRMLTASVTDRVCVDEDGVPRIILVAMIRDDNGGFTLPYRQGEHVFFDERPPTPVFLVKRFDGDAEISPDFRFDALGLAEPSMLITTTRFEQGDKGFWRTAMLQVWEQAAKDAVGKADFSDWLGAREVQEIEVEKEFGPEPHREIDGLNLWKYKLTVVPHGTLTVAVGHDKKSLITSTQVLDFTVN